MKYQLACSMIDGRAIQGMDFETIEAAWIYAQDSQGMRKFDAHFVTEGGIIVAVPTETARVWMGKSFADFLSMALNNYKDTPEYRQQFDAIFGIEYDWVSGNKTLREKVLQPDVDIYNKLAAEHKLPLLKWESGHESWETSDGMHFIDDNTDKRGGYRVGAFKTHPGGRWHPPETEDVTLDTGTFKDCLSKLITLSFEFTVGGALRMAIYPEPEY
jgi:hypothetical protein